MKSLVAISFLLVGGHSAANFARPPVMPVPVTRTVVNVNVVRVVQPQPIFVGSHGGGYAGGCGVSGGGCGGYRYAQPYHPYYGGFSGYARGCGHRHFRGARCGHRNKRCCRRGRVAFGFGFSSFGFNFGFNFARF